MKIVQSALITESSRTYHKKDITLDQVIVRHNDDEPDTSGSDITENRKSPILMLMDTVTFSHPAMMENNIQSAEINDIEDNHPPEEEITDPKLLLLKRLIEQMTGKKISLSSVKEPQPDDMLKEQTSVSDPGAPVSARENETTETFHFESHYESEDTHYQSSGIVNTADGREISFQVRLEMEREFYSEESLILQSGEKTDPLVINYDGKAVGLSDMTFQFDIDSDGSNEEISLLNSGSGFLSFDRNRDGIVNDGSELFGTVTGNGFRELEHYDSDKNLWIDENDPVFERLYLWKKDDTGNDSLISLKDAGIGAINLSYSDTYFSLKDSSNKDLGVVKNTGVFLEENGSAGTVQGIDFVV